MAQGASAGHPEVGGWSLASLATETEPLHPLPRGELHPLDRDRAGRYVDSLLVRVARGRQALQVSIGTLLARLDQPERLLAIRYRSLGDYARERLGMPAGAARILAKVAVDLRTRPQLFAAVWAGEVSLEKVKVVTKVAYGAAEAQWVELARTETVRSLQSMVAAALPKDEPAEAWESVWMAATADERARIERTLELAGRRLGAAAGRPARVRAVCQEFQSSFAAHEPGSRGVMRFPKTPRPDASELEAYLEAWTEKWKFLEQGIPTVGALPVPDGTDAFDLDAELRRLCAMLDGWELVLGRLALIVQSHKLWRDMQFRSLGHYCRERLGMSRRTFEQRALVERMSYHHEGLREALTSRRLSFSKALLLARCDFQVSIEWAEAHTVQALQARVKELEEAEAPNAVALDLPQDDAELLDETIRLAHGVAEAAGLRLATAGSAFAFVCDHVFEVWSQEVRRLGGQDRRLWSRKRGLCEVPGCTRAADHRHHVQYRSHGGGEQDGNKVLLCWGHHDAVHVVGSVTVRALSDGRFEWHLGVRPGQAPLEIHFTGPFPGDRG